MLDVQAIIAPIDFSERSAAALEHAGALAELLEADLIAAHFLPPPPSDYAVLYRGPADDIRLLPDLQERLGEFVSKRLGAFPVENIARSGDPSHGIEQLVDEKEAGLVVLSTHEYGLFRRMLLGSVASRLLHDLRVPILTGAHVPEIEPWNRHPYRRIVCAVGLDERSRRTLEFARDLAETCGSQLDLVHAAPSLELGGGAFGGEELFPSNLRSQIVKHYHDEVAELVSDTGCDATIHVDASNTVAYILSQVAQLEADLLVVGRAAQGRQRLVQELICQSRIPVLSL